MPQDPLERVQTLLFETRVNPLAILLDLASLLPQSMVQHALALARNVHEDLLRAFLVRELAKRLPEKTEQKKLTKMFPVPRGTAITSVSIPEGKEAKRLIARINDEQSQKVFKQLLFRAEYVIREGYATTVGPPDNTGGGTSFIRSVDVDGDFVGDNDRSSSPAASVIRIPKSV